MFFVLFLGTLGCTEDRTVHSRMDSSTAVSMPMPDAAVVDAAPPPDPLANQPDLAPEDAVLITVDGQERNVTEAVAKEYGYSIIDLSNDWVPTILAERRDAEPATQISRAS